MALERRRMIELSDALLGQLYEESRGEKLGLSKECFFAALERGVQKRFSSGEPAASQIEDYLAGIHLEDLALACACAEGIEAAWEQFFAEYRGYLRSAAGAILRCPPGAAAAVEFADSLFAELYGLADAKRGARSLFRYFHGRSSLKTWLRAMLAQRRVDAVRAARKFESLDGPDGEVKQDKILGSTLPLALDPDADRYIRLFQHALEMALAQLEPRDMERLRLYYAHEQTLAEIGRTLGEHESSVSRNLERIRREMRQQVEEILRRGEAYPDGSAATKGLSDAQIALCLDYAARETPIDLDKLFREKTPKPAHPEERQP